MRFILLTFAGLLALVLLLNGCASKKPKQQSQKEYSAKLKEAIEDKQPQITNCYQELIKKKKIPNRSGKVIFRIEIDKNGKLLGVESIKKRSDFVDERIDMCVRESLLEAKFPKNKMPNSEDTADADLTMEIYYPFKF